jgi:hypothetical protein
MSETTTVRRVQTVRIPQGPAVERRWMEVRERTIGREIDTDGRVLSPPLANMATTSWVIVIFGERGRRRGVARYHKGLWPSNVVCETDVPHSLKLTNRVGCGHVCTSERPLAV